MCDDEREFAMCEYCEDELPLSNSDLRRKGIRPEDEIEGNIDIWVDVQTPLVLSLCEFLNHIYVLDIVYSK